MDSLAHKLKIVKICEKRFFNHIRVVVSKKPLQKNTRYWRNETFLKIGHLAKAITPVKGIGFAKWSVWLTN